MAVNRREEADRLLMAYESKVEPFPARDELVELLALGLKVRAKIDTMKRMARGET